MGSKKPSGWVITAQSQYEKTELVFEATNTFTPMLRVMVNGKQVGVFDLTWVFDALIETFIRTEECAMKKAHRSAGVSRRVAMSKAARKTAETYKFEPTSTGVILK